MQDVTLPGTSEIFLENHKQPSFDVVGIIPATDKTPDIYYCDDAGSEKVAVLAFLTMWFLDAPIQRMVKERSSSVICALSPLAGGFRLEEIFRRPKDTRGLTSAIEQFSRYSGDGYEGRSYQPEWSEETGEMINSGWMAIYAISPKCDEERQYTAKQRSKLNRQFNHFLKSEEDKFYRSVSDRVFKDGVVALCEIMNNHPDNLDYQFSQLLSDAFWDVDDLFDMVPLITTHEIGHLLQYKTDVRPTNAISDEAISKIKIKSDLNYYRKASEAVAELAGIRLLKDIQRNAGLNYGLPTNCLDLILPNAYHDIDTALNRIIDPHYIALEIKREP